MKLVVVKKETQRHDLHIVELRADDGNEVHLRLNTSDLSDEFPIGKEVNISFDEVDAKPEKKAEEKKPAKKKAGKKASKKEETTTE